MKELPPLSRAMRLLLLQRAVLAVHEMYGCPLTDEAEQFFDAEVDAVYRATLVARRSAPPRGFVSAARAQCVLHRAARFGSGRDA